MKSGVVLAGFGEFSAKSEKFRQKMKEHNQHFIKPRRTPRSTKGCSFLPRINTNWHEFCWKKSNIFLT